MAEQERIAAPPAEEWTAEEAIQALWRIGDLRYLVKDYQLPVYDAFHEWNAIRTKRDQRQQWAALEAKFHNLWCMGVGRRWGKSAISLILVIEQCIRRPGSDGIIATAFQSSIASVVLKILKEVIEPEAPPGYCPEYRSSKDGQTHLLYIPATNSTIRLVGLDRHRDKTRGNALDFFWLTEAGFTSGLEETFISAITPQFKGRPWAWAIMESSFSPEGPDHDFHRVFCDDAVKRGAYIQRTIDDTDMSPEEIELELLSVGGRESPRAKREYLCIHDRDPHSAVIPAFDEARHCIPADQIARPLYAFAYTGMDPGYRDQCGVVWFYYDYMRRQIIVQAAWGERAATTNTIARRIKQVEQDLWGTRHGMPLQREPRPLEIDRLRPQRDKAAQEALDLLSIDRASMTAARKVWSAPEGSITYWDQNHRSLRPNPAARISDANPLLLADLQENHGLSFQTAKKGPGSREAHVQYLNDLFHNNRLVILTDPNNRTKQLIQQLRGGRWNDKRTDFIESAELGHLDLLMALSYTVREVDMLHNPYRPQVLDPNEPNMWVSDELRRELEIPKPISLGPGRYDRGDAGKYQREGRKWR